MNSKADLALAADEWSPPEFPALESGQVRKVEKKAQVSQKREPQMAALRRILGDGVLGVFPLGIMQAVDRSYQFWRDNPDSFLDTPFDTEQEKADALTVMRAYAECAPNGPYTIRTVTVDDPLVLSWRAQNRRGAKDDNPAGQTE